jgi:hypothetical protein
VVNAHIQRRLLRTRGPTGADVGGFVRINGIWYSKKTFPTKIGARGEWPAVLGGCRRLLTNGGATHAIKLLSEFAEISEQGLPTIQRVLLQNALWDVFASVYGAGTSPWTARFVESRRRWRELLWCLAREMSQMAATAVELRPYCIAGTARIRVLGVVRWKRAYQLVTYQQPTIHAAALGFRRVVRIYLYVPPSELGGNPRSLLKRYFERVAAFAAGTVAIEAEDAVAIARGSGLPVATHIPVILRSYRILAHSGGRPLLGFSLYRFRRGEARFIPAAIHRLPAGFATWALLNLPTIPNGSVGYLAKYPVVCAQCHFAGELQSFHSGLTRPRARYFRLVHPGTGYERITDVRRITASAAFGALQYYWDTPLKVVLARRRRGG